MATHRTDVTARGAVPGTPEDALDVADRPLVLVPDVRMRAEAAAITRIMAADLVPGRRSPRPRPANGRSEVVIRTHPRAGSLVRSGTRVDYELAPGEPMGRLERAPADRVHDAEATFNAAAGSSGRVTQDVATGTAAEGFVDRETVAMADVRMAGDAEEPHR